MDEMLGWMMALALLALFVYGLGTSIFGRRKDQAEARNGNGSISFSSIATLVGAILILVWMVSFGKASFVIPTPWFDLHSAALGLILVCVAMVFGGRR